METITVTGNELLEDFEAGFITADFKPKELVQDAICRETEYNDYVEIEVYNSFSDVCKVGVKVKEVLTPKEFAEVQKLNFGI